MHIWQLPSTAETQLLAAGGQQYNQQKPAEMTPGSLLLPTSVTTKLSTCFSCFPSWHPPFGYWKRQVSNLPTKAGRQTKHQLVFTLPTLTQKEGKAIPPNSWHTPWFSLPPSAAQPAKHRAGQNKKESKETVSNSRMQCDLRDDETE